MDSNFDGYTNSIYTITVGAIDRQNNHPMYSEECSAQMVVTYSSGMGSHIVSSRHSASTMELTILVYFGLAKYLY